MFRHIIYALAAGFVIGMLFSMSYGPEIIGWWWKPPGPNVPFACDRQITAATQSLVTFQLALGGLIAALAGGAMYIIERRRKLRERHAHYDHES